MSTNNSSIDTNIDSYSDDELYEILDLDTDASVDEISDRTNELYNRFLSENNYDMAYFFQAVQNKLLENEHFGVVDGILRCRLCLHILCHQFQLIFSPF